MWVTGVQTCALPICGVAIAPGHSFQTGALEYPAVRISLGSTSEDDLERGLAIVAKLYHSNPEPLLLAI